MNKTTKYATNGALFLGIGNALLNVIDQQQKINENPDLKFDWSELFKAAGKGALAGAAGGAIVGGIKDFQNSQIEPTDTTASLAALASLFALNKKGRTYTQLNAKAEEISGLLATRFSNELSVSPSRLGSTEKGTALDENYDIDIALTFKVDSFRNLKSMYYSVFQYFEEIEGQYSIIEVREQGKSIGVFVEIAGEEHKIDVVPKRLKKDGSTEGYLYKNESSFIRDNSSYTKTNFSTLRDLKLTSSQRDLVVLIKRWKLKNELPFSSHLIEYLVVKMYENYRPIPRDLTKRIIHFFQFIIENLEVIKIRGLENSNNVITDISDYDKEHIISAARKAIKNYDYQPNSIVEEFS